MPCDNDLIPPLLPNSGWGRYLNKTFKEEEIQVFLNNTSNYLLPSALFQPSEFFFLIDKNLAILTCLSRSSRPWVFCKKSVLWNFQGDQVSSCEFCNISKNTFSYWTPPVAVSALGTFQSCSKLVSVIFYQIFISDHTIALQKLRKMIFVSSKKLFSFLRNSNFCNSVFPSFSPSATVLEVDRR